MRKIGLLGGTFDPPHIGHLLLAESARYSLGLGVVYFVVAGDSYHKESVSPVKDRLAMTELAVLDNPHFHVSYIDAERDGPTYTIDTLSAFHDRYPDTEFFFIVGSDNIAGLNGWRDIDRVLDMATFVVAEREGEKVDVPVEFRGRVKVFSSLVSGISSSELRGGVRMGRSMRYATPPLVEKYVAEHHLYA
jgi:nicotinate-nucleotide adenylyltransferase